MPKLATLSFDDGGWPDIPIIAVLNNLGIPATFYLVAGFIDRFHFHLQLPEIQAAYGGHEIGCHTWTHPEIERMKPGDAGMEFGAARKRLQEIFGQDVFCFAWPYGRCREDFIPALKASGFKWARICVRNANETERPTNRWRLTVTDWLPADGRMRSCKDLNRIHLVGHANHIVSQYSVSQLEADLMNLRNDGFEFATNSRFFAEACP